MIKFIGYNSGSYTIDDNVIFAERYNGTWRIYQYSERYPKRVADMPRNWFVA